MKTKQIKGQSLLFTVLAISVLMSCQHDSFEDVNGIKAQFFEKHPEAPQPQIGDVIQLSLYVADNDDSVIIDTRDMPDFKMLLHKTLTRVPTIDDAIRGMHVGAGALFWVDAESFFVVTKKMDLPKKYKQGDMLRFSVKLKDILTKKKFEQLRKEHEKPSEELEMSLLKRFLMNENIKEKPSPSGLYYLEQRKGTGAMPQVGDKVTIHYVGLFIDGQPFDSSYDRGQPFTFTYGVGEVVQGLDEGLSHMKVGGKARLIIPSHLAYGNEQKGPIPPFSTLIFDVELIKIEPAKK